MKIQKINEQLENMERVDTVQAVEDVVTADAQQKSKEISAKTVLEKVRELVEQKAFLGAEKQPLPKDAEVPTPFTLDESLFNESIINEDDEEVTTEDSTEEVNVPNEVHINNDTWKREDFSDEFWKNIVMPYFGPHAVKRPGQMKDYCRILLIVYFATINPGKLKVAPNHLITAILPELLAKTFNYDELVYANLLRLPTTNSVSYDSNLETYLKGEWAGDERGIDAGKPGKFFHNEQNLLTSIDGKAIKKQVNEWIKENKKALKEANLFNTDKYDPDKDVDYDEEFGGDVKKTSSGKIKLDLSGLDVVEETLEMPQENSKLNEREQAYRKEVAMSNNEKITESNLDDKVLAHLCSVNGWMYNKTRQDILNNNK